MSPVVVSPAPNDSLEALSTADFGFVEGIVPRAFYRRSSAAGMRTRSAASPICLRTWTGSSRKALTTGYGRDPTSDRFRALDGRLAVLQYSGILVSPRGGTGSRQIRWLTVRRETVPVPRLRGSRSLSQPFASRRLRLDRKLDAPSSCRTRRARRMTTSPIRLGRDDAHQQMCQPS
jgi:hypothetical protein